MPHGVDISNRDERTIQMKVEIGRGLPLHAGLGVLAQYGNAVKGAYDRALRLDRCRELAQIWADLILAKAKPAKALVDGPHK